MARVSLKMSTATAAGFVHSDHLTVQTGYELMCEDTIQQPEVSAPMGEQKLSGTWPWRSLNKRRQFQTKSSRHSTFSIKLQSDSSAVLKLPSIIFPFHPCLIENVVFPMPFSCQVLMPFQPPQVGEQLLTASARHLRAWMEPTAEEQAYLRKYNDIDMVLLLTGEGPKYILKSQSTVAE